MGGANLRGFAITALSNRTQPSRRRSSAALPGGIVKMRPFADAQNHLLRNYAAGRFCPFPEKLRQTKQTTGVSMKKNIVFCAVALLTGSLLAADSASNDVSSAAKKLGDSVNYSWQTTVIVPDDSPFKPGPTDGKTEKGGLTYVKLSLGDNTTEFVKQGQVAAYTDEDGTWKSLTNLDNSQGPGRFLGGMVRNFQAPDAQAADLVASAKDLKKDGDVYASDLTADGAKALLSFRGRRGNGNGPAITNPSGSVKFWIKDGILIKYEFKVKGTVNFDGDDHDIDRDTTVAIKDVGTTKMDAPDAAKKLL
jgi:hypothetical protein